MSKHGHGAGEGPDESGGGGGETARREPRAATVDLPLDPRAEATPSGRLRDVPVRMLVPNLITLLAICSGLTAIRLAFEGRFALALVAIVFAAVLDAVDGRVARLLKSTSPFGEQMDSLADFVNFGVAPALILYAWGLNAAFTIGWVVVLIFAICQCLRLARFNVMLDDPDKPDWSVHFFTGVPAPAGALLSLLPIYLGLLTEDRTVVPVPIMAGYTVLVAYLMVSAIPTYSFKKTGARVSRPLALPAMLAALLAIIMLFAYPWGTLSTACVIYLAMLPFSWASQRRYAKAETRAAG